MTILTQSGALGTADGDVIPEVSDDQFVWTAPGIIRKLERLPSFEETAISVVNFSTTDTRVSPSAFFVTAYRSGPDDGAEIASYFDGWGIAIIPISEADYAAGRQNVFIMDSDPIAKNVVLGEKLHTGWGDYSYLASVSFPFYATTIDNTYNYNLELRIGDDNKLDLYLWNDDNSKPAIPTLSYAAHTPSTVGSYWGVSSSRTDSYEWRVSSIYLYATDAQYGLNEYRLNTDNFSESCVVKAYAMGSGYDSVTDAEAYGANLYIKNQVTDAWELKDSNTSVAGGVSALLDSGSLDLSTYGLSGIPQRVHAVISSQYPSYYDGGIDSIINIDYVYAESWDSHSAKIGGKADVYVEEAANPTPTYLDLINASLTEFLIPTNTKIQAEFYQPMLWITGIELLDFAGEPTGSYLTANVDYSISCDNENYRFSVEEEMKVIFAAAGWDVRIHYLTFTNIDAAQDYCDESLHRNLTHDILIKAKQPIELTMAVDVTTTMVAVDVRTLLVDWITQNEALSITTTEIETYLESNDNISDASVVSIEGKVHENDGSDTELIITNNTITRSSTQQFVLVGDGAHTTIDVQS